MLCFFLSLYCNMQNWDIVKDTKGTPKVPFEWPYRIQWTDGSSVVCQLDCSPSTSKVAG